MGTSVRDLAKQFDQKVAAAADPSVAALRLRTTDLEAAGFRASKNASLQAIWGAVADHNANVRPVRSLSDADLWKAIVRLDAVMYYATMYMTSKWQKDPVADAGSKRVLRWRALDALLQDTTRVLSLLGARGLSGPTDFGAINNSARSYLLERLDVEGKSDGSRKHRAGFVLSKLFGQWNAAKPTNPGTSTPMGFWEWLRTPEAKVGLRQYGNTRKKGVEYAEDGALWDHAVHMSGGRMLDASDVAFDTQFNRTVPSGGGWAICVLSTIRPGPAGRLGQFLFSASHVEAEFHHSSFLGGAPVRAAGEWVVDRGVVRAITAKSGHYRPSVQDMRALLDAIPGIPADAIIRPDLQDRANSKTAADPKGVVKFHTVHEFRSWGTKARVLRRAEVTAALPGWADTSRDDHTTGPVLPWLSCVPA